MYFFTIVKLRLPFYLLFYSCPYENLHQDVSRVYFVLFFLNKIRKYMKYDIFLFLV